MKIFVRKLKRFFDIAEKEAVGQDIDTKMA
jgi:hypothetical protein